MANIIDTRKWGIFQIKNIVDEPINTGNILARNIINGSGDTPFVTASSVNNGVTAHIDATGYEIYPGNCILVGGKTFTLTYQAKDFVSNDSHNFIIRLSGRHIEDDYLFFIAVLKASLSQKYSWGDAVTARKMIEEYISLPQNASTKEPDWTEMRIISRKMKHKAKHSIDIIKNIYEI